MTLYKENAMRPDGTIIDQVLKVYKMAEVKEQYISPYADECTFFETSKGYDYSILGSTSDYLRLTDFVKASWDTDYTDWSGSASIEIAYKKDYLEYLQKGAYVELFVNRFANGVDVDYLRELDEQEYRDARSKADEERAAYDKTKHEDANYTKIFYPITYPYVQLSFCGFISDVKYNTTTLEISCTGYGAILDEKASLTFKQMSRLNILNEVIYTAGLMPNIDREGLPDEIIDWTSKTTTTTDNSSSDSSSGDAKTGDDCTDTISMACLKGCSSANHYGSNHNFDDCCSTGYAVADTEYYKWARQFSSGEAMLRALRNIWKYNGYWNNRTCPQKLFNTSGFRCNCFDACRMVKVLCDSIGFPCVVVTGQAYQGGHGWNVIKANGKWLSFDLCYNAHANANNSTNMSMIY